MRESTKKEGETMEEEKTERIMKVYSFFRERLEALSRIPLFNNDPTLQKIGLTEKERQSAFREMSSQGFYWDIIEYLCWLSTWMVVIRLKQGLSEKEVCRKNREDCVNMLRLYWSNRQKILDSGLIENQEELAKIIKTIQDHLFQEEMERG